MKSQWRKNTIVFVGKAKMWKV